MNHLKLITYTKNGDYSANFESNLLLSHFQQSFPGDLFHFELHGATDGTLIRVAKEAVEQVTPVFGARPRITCFDDGVIVLRSTERFFLEITSDDGQGDVWDPGYRTFALTGFGAEKDVVAVRAVLADFLRRIDVHAPTIRWHYSTNGSRSVAAMPLDKPKPVFDAFYPWIDGGLTAYFDRFAASEDVVLVLLGEPGTGKTSFIRHLLWHLRWNCAVTYDSNLLQRDDLFVSYMTNGDDQVMVVEDADVFLTSRARDRNDMMARFLNVSDGLYKTNRVKKLIFTANIAQASQIDQALLREGRCFDCLMFRPLSFEEAVRAAQAADIAALSEQRDHTLAQLFATKQLQKIVRMGF